MGNSDLYRRIEAVRRFNRFYTQQIGVLQERLLRSPFSLAEARLIYELGQRGKTTATELRTRLGLDAGYLSRLLQGLKKRGLIDRQVNRADERQNLLSLSEKGKKAFAMIHVRSRNEIGRMLNSLSPADQSRLVKAMDTIEELLGARPEQKTSYLLRPHQPGDMGWVVNRHGVIYAEEYRWNEQFEAFVAGIVSKFIQRYDPQKERCWIAEKDGENVGSVFLVKRSTRIAKLRLLLIDPKARGMGIGSRLVDECVRFARQAGYRKIVLWTNHVLLAARHIYEKAGFRLVHEEPHHSFGHDLIGETWELVL
jgi:DNA-binding MarR family transcriptional regulator/N-acetylglutamate synthase-like GNAT family acetyltransferase